MVAEELQKGKERRTLALRTHEEKQEEKERQSLKKRRTLKKKGGLANMIIHNIL